MAIKEIHFVACSHCFSNQGLQLDAERIGKDNLDPCPNCGAKGFKKLPLEGVGALAHRFFVWGSISRRRYGAAPLIQFNEYQKTSINIAPWLTEDVQLMERLLGVGFFHYGPRLWMIGEIEPLKDLQIKRRRKGIIDRVLDKYPVRELRTTDLFYRIRINPIAPENKNEYDSPPSNHAGKGRLDSVGNPVLYASPDLEICIHECRVSAEDEIFVATLTPTMPLRLLDLSILLEEEGTTEFESLDMCIHMLFLARKHAYKITRSIADAARNAGFDGIIYPSYFSPLRNGQMPLPTTYGMSHRRVPRLKKNEQAKSIQNLALFGRPISDRKVTVSCINRLVLSRMAYEFHFGPTGS